MKHRTRVIAFAGVLVITALLAGCGERDDRRFPEYPRNHPLNQRTVW